MQDLPDTPENEDEENAVPPKPVDNPHLPLDGDPQDYGENTMDVEQDLRRSAESGEERDEPNDLSDIDREFDE